MSQDDGGWDDGWDTGWDDEWNIEERSPARIAMVVFGIGALFVLTWFVILPWARSDPPRPNNVDGVVAAATTDELRSVETSTSTTATSSTVDDTTPTTRQSGTTEARRARTTSSTSADQTDEDDDGSATQTTETPATTAPTATTTPPTTAAPATTEPPVTTAPPPTTQPTPTNPPGVATYPTLPDGSPVPVVAIFDVETITLSGNVPSEEAAQRLVALAIANSKFPDAEIVRFLGIEPNVPANVGVRVVELTSARFPESSAQILPPHAAELDRVATIMEALPNISVLVVGHADQRGSAENNFAISEERARAVVSYLVSVGIEPSRMSSRAVGEADLISLNDDAAALALNRRTEFVFYGLLAPGE